MNAEEIRAKANGILHNPMLTSDDFVEYAGDLAKWVLEALNVFEWYADEEHHIARNYNGDDGSYVSDFIKDGGKRAEDFLARKARR